MAGTGQTSERELNSTMQLSECLIKTIGSYVRDCAVELIFHMSSWSADIRNIEGEHIMCDAAFSSRNMP